MGMVRTLARPMLASIFLVGGVDAVLHPQAKADRSSEVGRRVAQALPVPLPDDPVQLVRLNGAVQVLAGAMLATGKLPRLSALVLAASLVPTTFAGHAFWRERDPERRKAQRLHFVKNASTLGGLLLAVVDTGGKPSLAHRGKDVAHRGKDVAHRGTHVAHRVGRRVRG